MPVAVSMIAGTTECAHAPTDTTTAVVRPRTRVHTGYGAANDTGRDTEKLRTALQNQQHIGAITLPSRMVLPGEERLVGYEKFISTLQQPRAELHGVDNALVVAGALLGPILTDDGQTLASSGDTPTCTGPS